MIVDIIGEPAPNKMATKDYWTVENTPIIQAHAQELIDAEALIDTLVEGPIGLLLNNNDSTYGQFKEALRSLQLQLEECGVYGKWQTEKRET